MSRVPTAAPERAELFPGPAPAPRRLVATTLRLPGAVVKGVALSIVIALNIAVLGGSIAIAALDLRLIVVAGGSMEPTLPVGSIVISGPVKIDEIRPGTVVTFVPRPNARLVTHRVVATKVVEGVTYFQTHGDANAKPDPNLVPAGAVTGEMRGLLPATVMPLLSKPARVLLPLALLLWALAPYLPRQRTAAPSSP